MNALMNGTQDILVIDDETAVCDLLRRGLKDDNFTVTAMGGVTGAVERVKEMHPCLVVLDLTLPDGNGMDLLRDIKASSPEVPVVILSGSADPEDSRKAVRMGACDFLKKPVDWKYLRNLAHLSSFLKESSKK